MPTSALILVNVSCESVPDHALFFIRNQVRSDTSPSRAQTSGPVRRQISASRTMPSTADGVSRPRVDASERLGTDGPIPGSIAGLRAAWFIVTIPANWQIIYCRLAGYSTHSLTRQTSHWNHCIYFGALPVGLTSACLFLFSGILSSISCSQRKCSFYVSWGCARSDGVATCVQ
jgi:hypothetical protein